MEEIIVVIKKGGEIEIECNGFTGDACNITKVAETALGLVSDTSDKPESYKNVLNEQQLNIN